MKTLRITNENLCTGCQLCALACSRKLGKGISLAESNIRVTKLASGYKVVIDLGKMTPELSEYVARFCPRNLLEVIDED